MKLFVVTFLIVIIQNTQSNKLPQKFISIESGLGYLGDLIFGYPSKASGKRVRSWTKESKENPEFLGTYAEGDILFPGKSNRYGRINDTFKWRMGIVPYEMDPRLNYFQKYIVWRAMVTFEKETCIRFRKKTRYDQDWVLIQSVDTGCYSSIGRVRGKQKINLDQPTCLRCGTIMHELMHAIGFAHEQSRYDRDEYVTIFFENINRALWHNFDKRDPEEFSTFGIPYDYVSLLHYSNYAFSRNKTITIVAKDGTELGLANYFTERDIKKIKILYKCGATNTYCVKWHIYLFSMMLLHGLFFF